MVAPTSPPARAALEARVLATSGRGLALGCVRGLSGVSQQLGELGLVAVGDLPRLLVPLVAAQQA